MLIGNVLEKTDAEAAWELCADKLADWVRTNWQAHKKMNAVQWEETSHEDPAAMTGLREEGFTGLVGLDYIMKWWGADDLDQLAGEVDVVWKVMRENKVVCYRSWIKLANQDFVLGIYKEEGAKRDATRAVFRQAFAQWKQLFEKV
jgi:predicted acetyltransferase